LGRAVVGQVKSLNNSLIPMFLKVEG
jgi:hypothetical protein